MINPHTFSKDMMRQQHQTWKTVLTHTYLVDVEF